MNIEGFISQTLQQIGAGIVAGQKQPGITVSPRPYLPDDPSNTATGHMIDQKSQRIIVLVQFDLSVVVQSKIGGDLSAKLEVLGVDFGGGKLEAGFDQTRVQRVKFHVPVTFPPSQNDA